METTVKTIETNKKLVTATLVGGQYLDYSTGKGGKEITIQPYTFNINLSIPCTMRFLDDKLPTMRFKNLANDIEGYIAARLEYFDYESEVQAEEYKTKRDKIEYIAEHQALDDTQIATLVMGPDDKVDIQFNNLFKD